MAMRNAPPYHIHYRITHRVACICDMANMAMQCLTNFSDARATASSPARVIGHSDTVIRALAKAARAKACREESIWTKHTVTHDERCAVTTLAPHARVATLAHAPLFSTMASAAGGFATSSVIRIALIGVSVATHAHTDRSFNVNAAPTPPDLLDDPPRSPVPTRCDVPTS